jgi:hypothetical protein
MIPDAQSWEGIRGADLRHLHASRRRTRRSSAPSLECLEARRLFSVYTGPSANLPLASTAGAFLVQVSGPGVVKARPAAGGAIDLTAYGTTADSTITITQTHARFHIPNRLLTIQTFGVRSGQLGGLEALPAELSGRMTPLTNSVSTFDIGALAPKAQVTVDGSLGEMTIGTIDLGPTGRVSLAEGTNAATPTPSQSGSLSLGAVTIGTMTLDGGRFEIGGDAAVPITIQGDLTVSRDGQLRIARDEAGGLTVEGSMLLDSGGQFLVGRNLNNLTVDGNLVVNPGGSGIAVAGALNGLTVNGYFRGQGGTTNPSAFDLGVGLNLTGLTVLGGITGQGGLINANVRAGGTISGVNVPYGYYQSTVQTNASMPT